ncbi:YceI family protein [Nocardia pseudobrasiliensis]|uniref:Polyisoprenoid-binding protein YceI n=1 Tax=Nocardia pseudobrasiliensis TaxID=45979 RepID=A0A370IE54_9NOCA|nr:YceI family protein [Nocardia pseudobrasiliensis]RDI68998.1 polyisoprenoid-binding protein YceI [Nocardia pseudobrasiliensis]
MTTSEQTLKAGSWPLDPAHSAVNFTVRHLGISKVRGRFNRFETSFVVDESGSAQVSATVHLDSFDTGNADRDAHVRSADLLHVEQRPTLTFTATEPVRVAEDFKVTGEVVIGDQTHPVTLDVEWGGIQEFPATGDRHIGFTATGTLKRTDFGVGVGIPSAALSDKIAIELDIQLIEPK